MTSAQDKFQKLLRELFQFDCADLDFGIYRIMNYKRDVIEQFIATDLPRSIAEELNRGELANQSQAAAELAEVAKQITQSLGIDAIDADGNLAETYHETPLGKKYLELKEKAADGRGREAIEATIFNHLHTFFSRYYLDGDFISKRRYSKRQKYAIPYNGEEVYLHWANHDQYYVKTAEHFHDYTFTSRGVIVRFKLKAAEVEQNNVKSETRFFVPHLKDVDWNEDAGELVIPFAYRPLTEQETVTYGTKNQQEKIIGEAVDAIPNHLKKADRALLAITAERRKNSDGESVSVLEHHLRQYTRRNTSDFFIHKDLKGFLSRELDFYLKNEVLNLDEMETAGENRTEGWFQVMRVIKAVGSRTIDFLDQVESFQKMLWEKRKFVTETQYCITVGTIDERFYPDIAACDAQWAEWKELFHIDEEQTDLFSSGKSKKDKRVAFLKAHPTLVLDTKYCTTDFLDRVLATFGNLDDLTDGLLVHSENWQALNLLMNKYWEKVQCIYIDPPYNTGNDGFLYRDNYQHSSWASAICDRTSISRLLLDAMDGCLFCSIDDGEQALLRMTLTSIFGHDNFVANVIWQKKYAPANDATWLSDDHDFLITFARNKQIWLPGKIPRDERQDKAYANPDNDLRGRWKAGDYKCNKNADERPNLYYPIMNPNTGRKVWPQKHRVWAYSPDQHEQNVADNRVWWGKDGTNDVPAYKRFLSEVGGLVPQTLWEYEEVGHNQDGIRQLRDLLPDTMFTSPKPVGLLDRVIRVGKALLVLDYFAGSGTTAHAVINSNRQDGERKRFILVEMGGYFDTVLLPRIKKVTFTPEWKDGKPKRLATAEEAERSPRIVKYIRLESYEDALNNIEFDEASGQATMKFDDYLLKYMLTWEARKSETLLNVGKLANPFRYKLNIHKNGEIREQTVDIPETFTYLLGLHVRTRRVYDDSGRRYLVYRGQVDHRQVIVIWRDTSGWEKKDLERDKRFVAEQNLTEGTDEIFVNGDSFIPGARALEPVFKARMFGKVEM